MRGRSSHGIKLYHYYKYRPTSKRKTSGQGKTNIAARTCKSCAQYGTTCPHKSTRGNHKNCYIPITTADRLRQSDSGGGKIIFDIAVIALFVFILLTCR